MTEIFANFEVNHDPKWPILTKLVAGSLALHLVLLWLVLYVPAFRDTLNVAALIANTTFVDEDYVATQIGDEVQIVQLEKFRYPDGYFALENQGFTNPAVAAANDPFAPKIISQWRANEVDPEASPSPSPDASASPAASPSVSPAASPIASASPSAIAQANASPSPPTQEEAQKELEKTAAANNVTLPTENEINKRPLKDLAAYANDLKNQGKLDLNKPFNMTIEAQLDENLKLQNFRFLNQEGDPILTDLFARMVTALNDSGLLVYLSGIRKANPGSTVKITLQQGENEVLATLESEATSPEDASQLAKGLNGLLVAGGLVRAGKDEAKLMKNTVATANGRKVVVNFSMPRETVVEMLKKQMQPGA
ncbi:MAG TPA: hypothetical protein VFS76_04045 [Pyrinomonadaceae bacterium]|nr:hypothetical protein [Pyrinomonadaceae bacterium]